MYCHNSTSERGLQGDIYTIYTILSSEDEREPTCQWHVAVARTTGHGWPYLTILSSEESRYSLVEWHLSEVMMNYLESDGRVASSELRHTCTPPLRPT